jgi:hypothetical protein
MELLELWDGEIQQEVLPRWLILEHLAILWEWELKDARHALACTEQALATLNGSTHYGSTLNGGADPIRVRLLHRRDRLIRKCGCRQTEGDR